MDEVETTTQGTKTFANVALAVGLFSAIGPFLHILYWNSSIPPLLPCQLLALGMLAGPVGVVLGAIALIASRREPHRFLGRWRAIGGLLTSLIGVGWLILFNVSMNAQYGPWGRITQFHIEGQLETLAKSLGEYCDQHDGRFPDSLDELLDHAPEVEWCLHIHASRAEESASATSLHYVPGLDKSCPPDWIVTYADSDLFDDEGGAFVTVDGAVNLLDEPEFGQALMQFKAAYERERGVPPEIVAPY